MLNWKPKNKFRPYISVSMNKEYIAQEFTKKELEKSQNQSHSKSLTNANKFLDMRVPRC